MFIGALPFWSASALPKHSSILAKLSPRLHKPAIKKPTVSLKNKGPMLLKKTAFKDKVKKHATSPKKDLILWNRPHDLLSFKKNTGKWTQKVTVKPKTQQFHLKNTVSYHADPQFREVLEATSSKELQPISYSYQVFKKNTLIKKVIATFTSKTVKKTIPRQKKNRKVKRHKVGKTKSTSFYFMESTIWEASENLKNKSSKKINKTLNPSTFLSSFLPLVIQQRRHIKNKIYTFQALREENSEVINGRFSIDGQKSLHNLWTTKVAVNFYNQKFFMWLSPRGEVIKSFLPLTQLSSYIK